jgi:hypothetical protein
MTCLLKIRRNIEIVVFVLIVSERSARKFCIGCNFVFFMVVVLEKIKKVTHDSCHSHESRVVRVYDT